MVYEYEEIKKTKREIITEPFYKNLVKVYDTVITDTNGEISSYTKTLIAPIENVTSLKGLKSISTSIYVPHFYQERANLYMLSKENYEGLLNAEKFIYDNIMEEYDDKIYNENDYMLVLFNYGSYELADLDGNYIPIAVHVSYEYRDGRMTNDNYDLNSILEILKDNKDIISIDTRRYSTTYNERCKLQITSIPSYNCDDDTYEQLDFYFLPSQEIYSKAMSLKNSYERVPYMLEKTFGIVKKDMNYDNR